MRSILMILCILLLSVPGVGSAGPDSDPDTPPKPETTILILVGEWFGDSYYRLEKAITDNGWRMVRAGIDKTYRGCYLKSRSVELESDVLLNDLTDFSAYQCLIIPSGPQFRKFVENPEVLEFVRRAYKAGLLIASFCTGNFVVNAAGITDFKDRAAMSPPSVTLVKERVLFGPWGGGPTPGSGFADAPIDEICHAIARELGITTITRQKVETHQRFPVGFSLLEASDSTRVYSSDVECGLSSRRLRIYLWYPAAVTTSPGTEMKMGDYVRMAVEDFSPSVSMDAAWEDLVNVLPVPLVKGLGERRVRSLMHEPVAAVRDAVALDGKFPLLVVGQGLYYESPLSQYALCEFLAGQGYVVATCPLLGTQYRLVNLTVADLETQIRDMEFTLATVRNRATVDPERIGLIGYDLGGMAGLVMTMRQPGIAAFLSLDAGILTPHFSGLPHKHPSYDERRFVVPWMHLTQGRFITASQDRSEQTLFSRKQFGDSYLVSVPTTSHGTFSSYANVDIRGSIPGYWEAQQTDQLVLSRRISEHVLAFFDAYLRNDRHALTELRRGEDRAGEMSFPIAFRQGQPAPPDEWTLVRLIIDRGVTVAAPVIAEARSRFPDISLIKEEVLNWLGYHFLYWWGREREAVEVFRLSVSLFPTSANAYDSLGEAYLRTRQFEAARECYRTSRQLDPENANAEAMLQHLSGLP